jgi:hypothetical protein
MSVCLYRYDVQITSTVQVHIDRAVHSVQYLVLYSSTPPHQSGDDESGDVYCTVPTCTLLSDRAVGIIGDVMTECACACWWT